MTLEREQLGLDLGQFVAFAGLVATAIVDGGWWLDDGTGVPWMNIHRAHRRARLRAGARARKARRGWR